MRLILTIAACLISAAVASTAFAFQIVPEAGQDTAKKDVRIILRGGEDVTIERDEDGRIIIDGLDIGDDELSLPGVRRALILPRHGQRVLALRGDSVDLPELFRGRTDRVLERFRYFDRDDWIDDLHVFRPGPPGLHFFKREDSEALREANQLERRVRELARRARDVDGAERERLDREIDDMLSEIFERRTELRRDRLARLENTLEEERERLEERARNREEIIERRKRSLLREHDPLDW